MTIKTIEGNIYDYPTYYDLIFGADWAAEFKFLEAAFAKHVTPAKKKGAKSGKPTQGLRLLEPACGTGRLIYRMAKAGYECAGLDLNEKAIDYCNKRLAKNGLPESAWVADMTDFKVDRPYDAAFNTINSFRHLGTEKLTLAHFRCLGEAIRPGGIYALGFHLTPLVGEATDEERWSARRGHLMINTHMWPRDKDPKNRVERFNLRFDVYRPTEQLRIDDCLVLRSYTFKQFESMIAKTEHWEIEEAYDFRYDINEPIEVDESTEDVVYILKRK